MLIDLTYHNFLVSCDLSLLGCMYIILHQCTEQMYGNAKQEQISYHSKFESLCVNIFNNWNQTTDKQNIIIAKTFYISLWKSIFVWNYCPIISTMICPAIYIFKLKIHKRVVISQLTIHIDVFKTSIFHTILYHCISNTHQFLSITIVSSTPNN